MTQSNPLQTREVTKGEASTRIAFWGTIIQAAILFLAFTAVSLLTLSALAAADPTDPQSELAIAYLALAVFATLAIVNISSIVLTIRKRQDLAYGLTYFSLTAFVLGAVLIVQGRVLILSFFLLFIAALGIGWICPPRLRRFYLISTVIAFALMWVIEWANPPWRSTYAGGQTVAPFAAIFFAIIFLGVIVRQAWSGNIRVKLVTSFTVIALISVAVVGSVVYVSYRNQVREDIRQRLLNMVSIATLQQDGDLHATLQKIGDEKTDAYKQIKATNFAIVSTDPEIAYLYTMRMDDRGNIYFVVDTGPEGSETQPLLDRYPDAGVKLVENFSTMNSAIVEDDFYSDEDGTFLSAYAPFYRSDGTREGIIGLDIGADKVLAQEQAVLRLILGTTLGTMVLVTLLGLFLGNLFVGPVINLSLVAKKIANGDLNARAKIETTDEIGELAKDFNIMTNQLQETLQGLEQRIADRTRNLELAAQVGRAVSQVRSLDVMLEDACNLILKEFNLYYVQVYLTDASGSNLKLEAGTGSVGAQLLGRSHSLRLDTNSINGRAAVEKHPVVISDTTQSATFRQNPLLPETQGEMAVPLIVGDNVVGVLDMQASQPGILTNEILPAFEALAGQMAVAIQNANLLAETEQARAEVEKQARRLVRRGWSEHLDAIHKPEQLGYMFDHNNITPLAGLGGAQLPENGYAISAPISVTGEPLGSLVVELNDEARAEQTTELVNVVARQMAQQVENLRLLESAERYRAEAEESSRRLTREGWKTYKEQTEENLSYLYDLNEVRPSNGEAPKEAVTTIPLKVRDEVIGKLAIQGMDSGDTGSMDLVNAVGERLSAHIESLRQFEETRRGQVELNKRAQQLAGVAEISTVSSKELDIEKMLQSVVFLTQRKFGLYHAHVFTLNEITQMLEIQACGWKEGDIHEGTHGTTAIPIQQERSLVARAARTKQPVIVNDVRNEPGWLPNPLLPDTASELAVPLLIGDQVLGVLDVQSDRLNAFTDEDASIQTTLASQVATSLQNARSFSLAQKQAERESMLNTISQKIQSATTVEAVLQIAARELGHALGAPMTIAQLSMKDNS